MRSANVPKASASGELHPQTLYRGFAPGPHWGLPFPEPPDKTLVPICLYCLNCTKFGQLILRKIIKIVATRCQILRLKCTKFDFS